MRKLLKKFSVLDLGGLLKELSQIPFYPALFGFCLGLCMDISAERFWPIEQALVLSLLLSTFALLLQIFLFAILREPYRAAILATILLAWIFLYGHFADSVSEFLISCKLSAPKEEFYFIAYCMIGAIAICLSYGIARPSFVSKYLNMMILFIFMFAFIYETTTVLPIELKADKAIKVMRKQNGELKLKSSSKPDIYYIILDAAGSSDTLRTLYGMKNIEFFEHLKQQGFYIAATSKSNYDRTKYSLSSSLNFNYINCLRNVMSDNLDAENIFCRLIQQSQVADCFKKLGYKIVQVDSCWTLTMYNPNADANYGYGFGNLIDTTIAARISVLRAFENRFGNIANMSRARRTWAFLHLNEVQKIQGPKFVFVHILLPHPPFLFTADGGTLPLDKNLFDETYTVEKYKGQITYTFSRAQKMIDELLTSSKDRLPIIVIQGDHGPKLNSDQWPYSQAYLKERFGILNAYFLPGKKTSALYPSVSPVNAFRIIFNEYFRANLPLLPDLSYYAPQKPPYFWTRLDPPSQKP